MDIFCRAKFDKRRGTVFIRFSFAPAAVTNLNEVPFESPQRRPRMAGATISPWMANGGNRGLCQEPSYRFVSGQPENR